MDNADVISYFDNMDNGDVVTNVMACLNGFIDIRPLADRQQIRSDLIAEGVTISLGICHRDGDDE